MLLSQPKMSWGSCFVSAGKPRWKIKGLQQSLRLQSDFRLGAVWLHLCFIWYLSGNVCYSFVTVLKCTGKCPKRERIQQIKVMLKQLNYLLHLYSHLSQQWGPKAAYMKYFDLPALRTNIIHFLSWNENLLPRVLVWLFLKLFLTLYFPRYCDTITWRIMEQFHRHPWLSSPRLKLVLILSCKF